MALPFFRALNPTSKNSGISYCLAPHDAPCQGKEMIDETLSEYIMNAYNKDLDFIDGLDAAFVAIRGEHFDFSLKGRYDCKGGSKGALDFLILPLIARKLLADAYLDEHRERHLSNIIAVVVAVPTVIVTDMAALALTFMLAPVVAFVHFLRYCMHAQENKNEATAPRLRA